MTHDITQDLMTGAKGAPQPPALEFSDYHADLAEQELTEEQEREMLLCLWDIVKMVVDADLGLDATSAVLSAISRKIFLGDSVSDDEATRSERKTP